jgi:hypothetical protein
MKLLYGSQNFGYDTEKSDKDWFEVVIPTWNDIISMKSISKEIENTDGSLTKVCDIRNFGKILLSGNMNDLQLLYSKCRVSDEEYVWFFNNRERIIRASRNKAFNSNLGMAYSNSKKLTPKNSLRIRIAYEILTRLLDNDKEFSVNIGWSRIERYRLEQMNEFGLSNYNDFWIENIESLKSEFEQFKEDVDLKNEIDFVIISILKSNLLNN